MNENAAAEKAEIQQQADRQKRYKRATFILLMIIIILLLLLLKLCGGEQQVLNPDYPPQRIEQNADRIPGDSGGKLEHEEGGAAVSLEFYDELSIDLSQKQASLYFSNPGRSTQDMMLQIVIQDVVVAQSGRILPGYHVSKLDLWENMESKLVEGVYSGKFVIYYYDPETNERAVVNTEAPVVVVVKP